MYPTLYIKERVSNKIPRTLVSASHIYFVMALILCLDLSPKDSLLLGFLYSTFSHDLKNNIYIYVKLKKYTQTGQIRKFVPNEDLQSQYTAKTRRPNYTIFHCNHLKSPPHSWTGWSNKKYVPNGDLQSQYTLQKLEDLIIQYFTVIT